MRWSFICPPDLAVNLDLAVWDELRTATRAAMEWVGAKEEADDLSFFWRYGMGLWGITQSHAWARRKDWDGVMALE
jgi:hypothetical protein